MKTWKPLQGMKLHEEKKEKNEKHIQKLFRKNLKIGVYQL